MCPVTLLPWALFTCTSTSQAVAPNEIHVSTRYYSTGKIVPATSRRDSFPTVPEYTSKFSVGATRRIMAPSGLSGHSRPEPLRAFGMFDLLRSLAGWLGGWLAHGLGQRANKSGSHNKSSSMRALACFNRSIVALHRLWTSTQYYIISIQPTPSIPISNESQPQSQLSAQLLAMNESSCWKLCTFQHSSSVRFSRMFLSFL